MLPSFPKLRLIQLPHIAKCCRDVLSPCVCITVLMVIQFAGLCQQGAPLLARRSAYRKQLKVAQLLLLLLPLPNYEVVVKLLGLLHNVSKAPHKDCMSPESLAKIFTPVIFCPREMAPDEMQANSAELARPVAFLIEHAPAVISYPEDLVEDVESWSRRMKQSLASPKDAATEVC